MDKYTMDGKRVTNEAFTKVRKRERETRVQFVKSVILCFS